MVITNLPALLIALISCPVAILVYFIGYLCFGDSLRLWMVTMSAYCFSLVVLDLIWRFRSKANAKWTWMLSPEKGGHLFFIPFWIAAGLYWYFAFGPSSLMAS